MMETSIFIRIVHENPYIDTQPQISHVYCFKKTLFEITHDDKQSEVTSMFSAFPYFAMSYLRLNSSSLKESNSVLYNIVSFHFMYLLLMLHRYF